nr:phosphate/phosphite/phosphonate ABC transporter substrate-binding protein [uncultured Desulfobacter sp.]
MKLLKILTIAFVIYQIFTSYAISQINFGTLSIIDPSVLAQRMAPITVYLSNYLDDQISLKLGRDYKETMNKLVKGDLDIGFIGPAPYVKIKDHVEIVATLVSQGIPFFHSVIVVRKDTDIANLFDLAGKKFAFGSPSSTLSFYVPAYILHTHKVLSELEDYNFLGKHDRVAKHVILGKYDAGGIKESVYFQYQNYLKILHKSDPFYDFVVVVRKDFDPRLKRLLETALLNLKDPSVLSAFKPGATGFIKGQESNYEDIALIIEAVDRLYHKK